MYTQVQFLMLFGFVMKSYISNRPLLFAAIIVFYVIPLFFFAAYSVHISSQQQSWKLLSLGLLLIAVSSLSLIFLISYFEHAVQKNSPPNRESHENAEGNKVTLLETAREIEEAHESPEALAQPFEESSKELNLLQAALEKSEQTYQELLTSIEEREKKIGELEIQLKEERERAERVAQDFADYKLFSDEQLKQKQLQLTALQELIEDQRSEMDKRQEQIHQLDTKVHDLSYEIKTLLYLHEEENASIKPLSSRTKEPKVPLIAPFIPPSRETKANKEAEKRAEILEDPSQENAKNVDSIHTSSEALSMLKKCIAIAQKLTGGTYHQNDSTRYRSIPSTYLTIDQRRLFDSLKNEKGALIILYSLKEQKPLFVNQESLSLLGWNPETFLSNFGSIMQEGILEWKKALQILTHTSQSAARLLIKTKEGQEVIMNCQLGLIPTGLFRHFAIAVLYPA